MSRKIIFLFEKFVQNALAIKTALTYSNDSFENKMESVSNASNCNGLSVIHSEKRLLFAKLTLCICIIPTALLSGMLYTVYNKI